jgi:hypothetical protein
MVLGLLVVVGFVGCFDEEDDLKFLEVGAALAGAQEVDGSWASSFTEEEGSDNVSASSEEVSLTVPQQETGIDSSGSSVFEGDSSRGVSVPESPESPSDVATEVVTGKLSEEVSETVSETVGTLSESPPAASSDPVQTSPSQPPSTSSPEPEEGSLPSEEGTDARMTESRSQPAPSASPVPLGPDDAVASETGLAGGVIAAIIVGVLLFAAIIIALGIYFVKKKGGTESTSSSESSNFSSTESQEDDI